MSKAVKCYSRNSGHCFATFIIQLILFLHVVYCSVFRLAALFILHAIEFSVFFNTLWHWACLPSSCVSLYLILSVCPTLSYSLPFISWHKKATTVFDLGGWLHRCCFVVINTYSIYVKTQMHSKDFTGSFFTAYMAVQHSPNLL